MGRDNSGFTLVELLLVIALIIIVATMSLPVARSLQTTNDVDVATITLAQSLRQAQLLALSGSQDDNWGVQINAGTITIYRGSSFSSRVSGFDQVADMAGSIAPSGLSEVNYAKITGIPSATGSFLLTGLYGKVNTLSINAKGMVSY